jgi:CMP/dCMP kinase
MVVYNRGLPVGIYRSLQHSADLGGEIDMTDRIPRNLIITIDGPSGAGKSTVAKMIAHLLNYTYIDTGAMYRGVACAYARRLKSTGAERMAHGDEIIEKAKSDEMNQFLEGLSLRFEFGEETKVFLNGEDISKTIREPAISMLASKLSQNGAVREYLYTMQRALGKDGGIVLEGRDTGSVVFPKAHAKFYLDANPEERAKRRHGELSSKGTAVDISAVKKDMVERDKNDSERDLAPLVIPEGAIYVDTSGLDVEGVTKALHEHIAVMSDKWKQ